MKIPIKFVKQEDECGCAIACLAMITGQTYQKVLSDFEQKFSDSGVSNFQQFDYLSDFGFQIVTKQVYAYANKDFFRQEITKPFADAHIVSVKPKFDSPMNHAVVMDAKGKIYCPNKITVLKEVYSIEAIIGVFKQI